MIENMRIIDELHFPGSIYYIYITLAYQFGLIFFFLKSIWISFYANIQLGLQSGFCYIFLFVCTCVLSIFVLSEFTPAFRLYHFLTPVIQQRFSFFSIPGVNILNWYRYVTRWIWYRIKVNWLWNVRFHVSLQFRWLWISISERTDTWIYAHNKILFDVIKSFT